MSQSCLTFALPSLVNHAWLYLATISQSQINYFFPTISQTWLTFALPPSIRHGWLLATISQTRLTPCHHQSDTADSLPPMSRTPCPVVTNVLDIQHLQLRALYTVHVSWMNIAVCKQVSGWLTGYCLHMEAHTQSWTLYHLCDSISISIKQMSLSHHVWYICWCGGKIIIMFSWSVATLNGFLSAQSFCLYCHFSVNS